LTRHFQKTQKSNVVWTLTKRENVPYDGTSVMISRNS